MTFHSHFGIFGYENLIPARIISPLLVFWRRKNVIGEIIRLFLFYHLIFHNLLGLTLPHHYNINAHAFKFGVILSISKPLCYIRFLKLTSSCVFLFLLLPYFHFWSLAYSSSLSESHLQIKFYKVFAVFTVHFPEIMF